jgi:hypothetical protein
MQVSCVKSRRFEIFRSNVFTLRRSRYYKSASRLTSPVYFDIYIQGKIRKKGPSVDFKLNCAVE